MLKLFIMYYLITGGIAGLRPWYKGKRWPEILEAFLWTPLAIPYGLLEGVSRMIWMGYGLLCWCMGQIALAIIVKYVVVPFAKTIGDEKTTE